MSFSYVISCLSREILLFIDIFEKTAYPRISMTQVRVRIAPSPTGKWHIGNLRTALYNWLFARQHGGTFVLRVEDTDRTRYVEGAIQNMYGVLAQTGIEPDEGVRVKNGVISEDGDYGPYIQSARQDKHLAYAQDLLRMDKAYYCFCTSDRLEQLRHDQEAAHQPSMYDGTCRAIAFADAEKRVMAGEKHVIRLKLPRTGNMTVQDLVRGSVAFEWALIDDQVIIKSDGFPTYHLAATCDDHDMRISHVFRGEEWLSSTPKHVFIYESFGWQIPQFAHLPLLLNSDKSKLSKRQGDVAAEDYLSKGYLPEALMNFLALLGWSPSDNKEIFSKEELIKLFDITKVNKAGAVFNIEKLDWFNAQYLRALPVEKYLEMTRGFVASQSNDAEFVDRCLLLVRDRIVKPQDVIELTQTFFIPHLTYLGVSLSWKTQSKADVLQRLAAVKGLLESMTEEELRDTGVIEQRIKQFIVDQGWGNGDTLWPLRVSLSGLENHLDRLS